MFQDTCVALQALSQYAIFSYIGGVNLRVSLGCTTDGTVNCSKEFDLNNENDKVLQTANIPQLPTEVFVNANGVGCALLQVRYFLVESYLRAVDQRWSPRGRPWPRGHPRGHIF